MSIMDGNVDVSKYNVTGQKKSKSEPIKVERLSEVFKTSDGAVFGSLAEAENHIKMVSIMRVIRLAACDAQFAEIHGDDFLYFLGDRIVKAGWRDF